MMKVWVFYAILSMIFAGFTSVIAKMGLSGITGELGLTIRTIVVFAFVMVFGLFVIPLDSLKVLTRSNFLWLGLSGVTTSLSWIFYYKALKMGDVATVALIDKGSILVAIFLAWLVLREQITPRMLCGAAFMLVGLLIIAKK